MLHTFIALVDNKPGVLTRIASLFRRLNLNIASLTVGETEREEVSRMTIVCDAPENAAHRIRASLYKLEITRDVDEVGRSEAVIRELALIKVAAGPPASSSSSRTHLFELAEVFRARIVDLVRFHLFHYTDEWNDATVRRWMKRVGTDRIEDLYSLKEADVRSKGRDCSADLESLARLKAHVAKVIAAGAALSTRDLKVNGKDLMRELSLPPGPILGKILLALLDDVITDPAKNEPVWLLERAREIAKAEGSSTS